MVNKTISTFLAGLFCVAGGAAEAQKSKDTVRLAITEALPMLSPYYLTSPESAAIYRNVFQPLMMYHEKLGRFVPALASSWKRADELSIDFDLRENVKFHNGSTMDADDVVYIANWAADPNVKFRFKGRFDWIAKAEKLGPHKVRITSKVPYAIAEVQLAYQLYIHDSRTQKALSDPTDYGKKPIGTGPFQVTRLDPNRGMTVQKFSAYQDIPDGPVASVGRVEILAVPDQQTQIAEFLAGNLDIVKDINNDFAIQLAKDPKHKVSIIDGINVIYLQYDAAGRTDQKALTDIRVRRALSMAIDREALKTVVVGRERSMVMDALCFRIMNACDYSTKPPPYDPAAARKLLEEAGQADKLKIDITAFVGPSADLATIISGAWHRIGVEARIQTIPLVTIRKMREEGKLQALVNAFPGGGMPDASNTVEVFFGDQSADYARDARISELRTAGLTELDPVKRKSVYRELYDRINQEVYFLPLVSQPSLFAHSADVGIKTNSPYSFGLSLNVLEWK